ncbi:MAG: DUF420 domain-containing protein [Planctomycetes bacterium]|nr:DUF420 domain-containing protein [Planctomycetota bacterium]
MIVDHLPVVNAGLNATATVLLILGWRAIRRGRIEVHKRFMLAAVAASAAFLACYLTYHYAAGHTVFTHPGWPKALYLTILATHVPLATLMVIPILILLRHALKGRIDQHRRLARWTLPVWLYVSVTGVLIYFMLYQWFPA